MFKDIAKKFISFLSNFKGNLFKTLFKGSPTKKKIFEAAGYILVTYHLTRFGIYWYKNRKIENNLTGYLEKIGKNVTTNNRWIVMVIPDSTFNASDWLMKYLINENFSVFFGNLF